MDIDPKLKNYVIEMLSVSTVDSVISFCEENGVDGRLVDLLKTEKHHCEMTQLRFSQNIK